MKHSNRRSMRSWRSKIYMNKQQQEHIFAEAKKQQKREDQKALAKRVGLWVLVTLGLVLMVWGLTKLALTGQTTPTDGIIQDPVTSADWQQGNPLAKNVLIEYSDFQCPACAAFYPVVKALQTKYGSSLLFVYRQFPLSIHEHGDLAARASEAAGKQGAFWPMHDLLFEGQRLWGESPNAEQIITGYAEKLGLNQTKFIADWNAPETEQKIQASIATGQRANVDGTPSFYLNGKKITNLRSYDDLASSIEQALQTP